MISLMMWMLICQKAHGVFRKMEVEGLLSLEITSGKASLLGTELPPKTTAHSTSVMV